MVVDSIETAAAAAFHACMPRAAAIPACGLAGMGRQRTDLGQLHARMPTPAHFFRTRMGTHGRWRGGESCSMDVARHVPAGFSLALQKGLIPGANDPTPTPFYM